MLTNIGYMPISETRTAGTIGYDVYGLAIICPSLLRDEINIWHVLI